MYPRNDSVSILEALVIAAAFIVVAFVFAYVILSYNPTVAPVEDDLSPPNSSVMEMHYMEIGQSVTLVTTDGEQYRIEISQDADGYHISIKHPVHEVLVEFTGGSIFGMSYALHVGEIYLQCNQNSWWLWYPNEWSIAIS